MKNLTQKKYFKEVNNFVKMLTIHWRHYTILYGTSKKRIDLLNESDNLFFFFIEQILFEKIQTELYKLLLDKPKNKDRNVKNKDKNYLLEELVRLVREDNKELGSRLYKMYNTLKFSCADKNLKDIRHKKISHNAQNIYNVNIKNRFSRKDIEKIIQGIIDIMNEISVYYDDSEELYFSENEHPYSLEIINKLVQASRYEELLKENDINYNDDMIKSKHYKAIN